MLLDWDTEPKQSLWVTCVGCLFLFSYITIQAMNHGLKEALSLSKFYEVHFFNSLQTFGYASLFSLLYVSFELLRPLGSELR